MFPYDDFHTAPQIRHHGDIRAPIPDVVDLDIYRGQEHLSYGVFTWELSEDKSVLIAQSGVHGPIRLIAKAGYYWDVVESPPVHGVSRKGWVTAVERWIDHEG